MIMLNCIQDDALRKPEMIKKAELLQASTKELLKVFEQLEAPTLEEMSGEYAARLLAQPNWLATFVGGAVLRNHFHSWMCKAFKPIDASTGQGYNTFLQGKRVIQRFPMRTLIAPSRLDGGLSYQLVYRRFHSLCGSVNMVDEVRRISSGLYLGIGTYGFTDAQRLTPYPFLLEGPIGVYRGDIGRARKNFKIERHELPSQSIK
ncbi:hypothetical protein ACFQ0F_05975 [Paraperlucidibaca wandonensis]|uniref:Uncharacterized protein n=1 Tax=Paraperlucidibaca wandonensis TaxID=1268273 RepID=A0ABW3HFF3_9GAMM